MLGGLKTKSHHKQRGWFLYDFPTPCLLRLPCRPPHSGLRQAHFWLRHGNEGIRKCGRISICICRCISFDTANFGGPVLWMEPHRVAAVQVIGACRLTKSVHCICPDLGLRSFFCKRHGNSDSLTVARTPGFFPEAHQHRPWLRLHRLHRSQCPSTSSFWGSRLVSSSHQGS